ncbi:uncharacterized protein LOC104904171 [Beta vulgaris subsp. vulgaris]|uniref:uncharacterized protein LOC104904171 n=1 Tax=Beta vulgaris subsp. vulgaris TaxID=3555 RepID=UPI00053F9314|nr:uncharacterized protein LOC104904171 [Beta vulgaris subsp. vulgaris]
MASSPFSKSAYHARSISLPSRPQQVDNQLHQQLCRLRSSQATSTSSSSSLSYRLTSLKDLYSSVVELLQMPSNQQTLSQIQQTKWVEELLDGSLRLLDICGTSRDVLLQSKERIQDMQSTLRRRSSGELDISNEIVKYLNTRKTAKKTIMKCLKHIKVADKNAHSNAIECILKDVEEITVIIFKSLLSHIAGVKLQSQKNSWSVIAQLLHHSADKEGASSSSIFDTVDATLVSLICQKKKNSANVSQLEEVRRQMSRLESEIQDLDEVLECLFKRLLKTRSALLNIFSS